MTNMAGTHQYGVHITTTAGCVAYRRDLSTGLVDATFDLSTISSNPLSLPLIDPTDGHFIVSIGVDADDVLHVSGNDHDDGTDHRYVSCPAAGFTTAANWTHHPGDFDSLGTGNPPGYTYNLFDRTSDGTLLWFLSQSEDRTNSVGRDWLGFKRVDSEWVPLVSDGHFAVTTADPDRVYMTGIECHPRLGQTDRVYVTGIWRMDDTDGDSQIEPWILYSDDLSTWRNIDGTSHTMPLTYADRTGATISTDPDYTQVRMGIAVDSEQRPYVVLKNGLSTDPEAYDIFVWLGSTWFGVPVSPLIGQIRPVAINGNLYLRHAQTGRVALKHQATGNLFRIGGPMQPGGIQPNHDPIRLRRHGIYSTCIGDGDTPVVYEYGNGVRRPT
jgi:hypothetical protein